MKYIIQLSIILGISFLGEVCKYFLPFPIPASIYGLVILFVCLETKIIKLESIQETAKCLVEIMPVMFIPAGVGLLESWGVLKPVLVPVVVIMLVSTVVVMAVSGWVTQGVIRCKKSGQKKQEE
ncbi:MAG: CidA/LrgA family protein [Butyribacter sp.]|nr:CidA/LrgA family protein [bacterium]MDY3854719.1 CidA/LrgA family protein [Butyribacter sp.]